jgi:hypothetical protein
MPRRERATGSSMREPLEERFARLMPQAIRGVLVPEVLNAALGEAYRLANMREAYEHDREDFVLDLRLAGVSWDGCGFLLGVSGESVRQQYGDRVEERTSQLLDAEGWEDE